LTGQNFKFKHKGNLIIQNQKIMKKVSLKLATVLMFVVLMSSAASAQPGSGNGKGMADGTYPGISNLSAEQEQQIEKLRTAHQKEMLPLRNQLGEMEAKLRTLTTGDKVDMALVNKQLEDISGVKLAMAKKREAHKQDVRKLLTEDQRVQFDMHAGKGKGGDCGKHGKGQRGGGQGNGNGNGYGNGNGPRCNR